MLYRKTFCSFFSNTEYWMFLNATDYYLCTWNFKWIKLGHSFCNGLKTGFHFSEILLFLFQNFLPDFLSTIWQGLHLGLFVIYEILLDYSWFMKYCWNRKLRYIVIFIVFRVWGVIKNIKIPIKISKRKRLFCSNKIIYLSYRTLQFDKYLTWQAL